jgi:mRNA interferase MazF
MSYSPGDVVLVRFPFTDRQGSKQRPAAVVSSSDYNAQRPDVILLALTSQIRTPLGFGEALLRDWQDAGLLKPSVFKPILFTVEQTLVRRTLGQLGNRDRDALRAVLRTLIDFG